jgi:hypothetical protein
MSPVVCALMTLTVFLSCDARAEHIGSQDTPVGSLRLCVGEKGRSRADSLLENKWTFYFDMTTYRRLEEFVITHMSKGPVDAGSEPESSFSVTWRSKNGRRKYIVSPKVKCAYLKEVVHTVTGEEYADFRRVGEDLMARERCRPLPK